MRWVAQEVSVMSSLKFLSLVLKKLKSLETIISWIGKFAEFLEKIIQFSTNVFMNFIFQQLLKLIDSYKICMSGDEITETVTTGKVTAYHKQKAVFA